MAKSRRYLKEYYFGPTSDERETTFLPHFNFLSRVCTLGSGTQATARRLTFDRNKLSKRLSLWRILPQVAQNGSKSVKYITKEVAK